MKFRWGAAFVFVVACEPATATEGSDPAGLSGADGSDPAPSGDGASGQHAEDLIDAGSGTTWTDLYRDLFGPTAPASCAGNGVCHGGPNESGARGSNGYVCADQKACRESMLSLDTGLVQASDADAPERSTLVTILRRRSTKGVIVGSMPKRSSYVFGSQSIRRIEIWIANGAPDD